MTLESIREITEIEYHNLWEIHNGAVFQDSEWLKLVISSNQKIEYYGFYHNDVVIDAFAAVKTEGRVFRHYTMPWFTPFLGWIRQSQDTALILSFLKSRRPHSITYATNQITPSWKQSTTFIINLEQSKDEIFAKFRQDKRRNVKKALSQELEVSWSRDFLSLKFLVGKTYERQGKGFGGYDKLEKIINVYPHLHQIKVSLDNNNLATLLYVHDKTRIYYLIGGFDQSANNHYAGPFAMWKGIEHSKEIGLITFDFEGSEIPSIAAYFESFGGEKTCYYTNNYYSPLFSLIKQFLRK